MRTPLALGAIIAMMGQEMDQPTHSNTPQDPAPPRSNVRHHFREMLRQAPTLEMLEATWAICSTCRHASPKTRRQWRIAYDARRQALDLLDPHVASLYPAGER